MIHIVFLACDSLPAPLCRVAINNLIVFSMLHRCFADFDYGAGDVTGVTE
jgi:hypothetical protein